MLQRTWHSALPQQPSLSHAQPKVLDNALIAGYVSVWIITMFIALSARVWHWFLIPVFLSSILIGIDAVDWFRSRSNIFDPVGIIGLLGFHFFFLAPLLHVLWDLWTLFKVVPPPDWRDWLGNMAALNSLGLLMYRVTRNLVSEARPKDQWSTWHIDRKRFFPIVAAALFVAGVAQVAAYVAFGGITEFIRTSTELGHEMQGFGIVFMISETFPILTMMTFAIYAERKSGLKRWPVLLLGLLVYLFLQLFFGGLRGSRSSTIWSLFWALGIVHFWLRPVPRQLIYAGCLFLLLFMYVFGFYKHVGLDAFRAFPDEDHVELAERTNTTLTAILLGDLGRSDIQAFLLYRLSRPDSDYELALGRTYLAGVSKLIPRSLLDRAPTKVKEGTEVQYGLGTYVPGVWQSSKVYGLAGETMLNFGPGLVPFSFVVLGLLVGRLKRLMISLAPNDSRRLLLPFLVNFCFVVLVGDLDNYVFFLFKNGALPVIVLILSSTVEIRNS